MSTSHNTELLNLKHSKSKIIRQLIIEVTYSTIAIGGSATD